MPWFEVWAALLLFTVCLGTHTGCTSEDPSLIPQDASVTDAEPLAWSVVLEGPYVGEYSHDASCAMFGEWLEVLIEIGTGGTPRIPVRPDMQCSMTEDSEQWRFHCRGLVYAGWVNYFDDFTFKVNKKLQQNGIFVWWLDGSGYFECVHLFWLERATFQ